MYQHICENCGKIYENYKKNSTFCSIDCRVSNHHKEFLAKSKKLIGKKFGRLTILDTKIENQKTKCFCLCECGNKIWTSSSNLKNGHSISCGCYQKEVALNNNSHYLEKYRKENHIENTNLNKLNSIIQKNNKSGIRGVYWHSQSKKWVAQLSFKGYRHSKEFKKIDDAIKYRKELEERYFKPFLDKYKKEAD